MYRRFSLMLLSSCLLLSCSKSSDDKETPRFASAKAAIEHMDVTLKNMKNCSSKTVESSVGVELKDYTVGFTCKEDEESNDLVVAELEFVAREAKDAAKTSMDLSQKNYVNAILKGIEATKFRLKALREKEAEVKKAKVDIVEIEKDCLNQQKELETLGCSFGRYGERSEIKCTEAASFADLLKQQNAMTKLKTLAQSYVAVANIISDKAYSSKWYSYSILDSYDQERIFKSSYNALVTSANDAVEQLNKELQDAGYVVLIHATFRSDKLEQNASSVSVLGAISAAIKSYTAEVFNSKGVDAIFILEKNSEVYFGEKLQDGILNFDISFKNSAEQVKQQIDSIPDRSRFAESFDVISKVLFAKIDLHCRGILSNTPVVTAEICGQVAQHILDLSNQYVFDEIYVTQNQHSYSYSKELCYLHGYTSARDGKTTLFLDLATGYTKESIVAAFEREKVKKKQ